MTEQLTKQDIWNLKYFFDIFIDSPKDVEYYTGYCDESAESIFNTIEKIRKLKNDYG